jgi:hypothetical protein
MFKGDVSGAILNNFIYNPGQRAVHYNLQSTEWDGHEPKIGEMDLVGNVLKYGPSSHNGLSLLMLGGVGDLSLYDRDNIAVDRWGNPAPQRGSYEVGPASFLDVEKPHFDLSNLPLLPPENVEDYVLKHVGARPWDRDTNDVRVLADMAEGRGKIIDSQDAVGGYPTFVSTSRIFDPKHWNMETMEPLISLVPSSDN